MKTLYVAGLYYNEAFNLLIHKKKPGHWQDDKHNLLGGHIENGENPHDAMCREFEEEAGLKTYPTSWKHCLTLSGPNWVVYFFLMHGPTFTPSDCDEGVIEWHVGIPKTAIPNLNWIIPLLKDKTILFPVHIQDSK